MSDRNFYIMLAIMFILLMIWALWPEPGSPFCRLLGLS